LIAQDKSVDAATLVAAQEELANLEFSRGDQKAAYALQLKALDEQRARLPPTHPDLLETLSRTSGMPVEFGNVDPAEALLQEQVPMAKRLYGEQSVHYADILEVAASLDQERRRFAAAKALRSKELDIKLRVLGDKHPGVAGGYFNLGVSQDALGENAEAV